MDENFLITQLIPHIFLPLKLPSKTSKSLFTEENYLLSLLQQTLLEYKFIPQIKETCSAFETWVKIQVKNSEIAIDTLQPGQLFALYVRAQNCGLLVSIPKHKPKDIIWSTFPVSQNNSVVTGSSGDLQLSYPATSIEVKRRDVLQSNAFARQLEVLMNSEFREAMSFTQKAGHMIEEIRDVNNTIFISGWLPALLVTQESAQSLGDIPRVTKKIRDSVVYGNALLPFRRSGMWTAAKVVLHISLVRDLDNVLGLFIYKIIILRIMLKFLQSPVFPAHESTGIEMLKKVGRRIRKLEEFKKKIRFSKQKPDLTEAYDTLVIDATKIITSARNKIDMQWKNIIDRAEENSIVTLKGAHFNMTQSLTGNGLSSYLGSSSCVKPDIKEVSAPHVPPRHRNSSRAKYIHNISMSVASSIGVDIFISLFDFERNVWQNWSDIITVADYEYVWNKFHDYVDSAMRYYKSDPVGMSRAIITTMKMIQVWDQCVCIKYPLLKSYKIGIQTSFIHMLLVTTKEELEIVNTLEAYFLARGRSPNSSILEERPNHASFSVCLASQRSDMKSLKNVILEEGRQRSEEKIREVEAARTYCQSLRTKISRMSHTYCEDIWGTGTPTHSNCCELCRLTQEVI